MPRPQHYTRSRRTAMQVILWVVFGGTLGLAALVGRHRSDPREVQLGETPTALGTIWVRLPAGWGVGDVHSPRPGVSRVRADEPPRRSAQGVGINGRELVITEERVTDPTTLEYVTRQFPNGLPDRPEAVYIAGRPGMMVAEQALESLGGTPNGWRILAGVMLPSGSGVTIQMVGLGQLTEADRRAVRDLAAGVEPIRAGNRN